jgi:ribosomal protein L11 methyltransferase
VLYVRVPDAVDDEIAAVLGGGSLGVEVAAFRPGVSELRVFLEPGYDAAAWRERAAAVLAAHGVAAPDAMLAVEPVEDGRWVERWQESLAPIPLGTRFVVVSTGEAPAQGREAIRLVPGMAFGTGDHETTRMCAAAVERLVTPGSRWCDLGAGTGVLSVIAARSGASRVLALDTDPEAVEVASEVLAANAAAGAVELRVGSVPATRGETFDGVVANIQSSFFLAEADAVADALASGGVLIASGFLNDDVDEIASAFSSVSLRVDERLSEGAWACLIARRDAR